MPWKILQNSRHQTAVGGGEKAMFCDSFVSLPHNLVTADSLV
jgi:hypothetical protein